MSPCVSLSLSLSRDVQTNHRQGGNSRSTKTQSKTTWPLLWQKDSKICWKVSNRTHIQTQQWKPTLSLKALPLKSGAIRDLIVHIAAKPFFTPTHCNAGSMHLCRPPSNVSRLPLFLKLQQNQHVWLTFGKVHRHNPCACHTKRRFNVQKCSENGVVLDFEVCFTPQQRAIFDRSSDQMAPHPPL